MFTGVRVAEDQFTVGRNRLTHEVGTYDGVVLQARDFSRGLIRVVTSLTVIVDGGHDVEQRRLTQRLL